MFSCSLRIERSGLAISTEERLGRGHLIKERLEEMMILPVDQRDPRRGVCAATWPGSVRESTAEDDDVGMVFVDRRGVCGGRGRSRTGRCGSFSSGHCGVHYT
jgi:hypothetical protein